MKKGFTLIELLAVIIILAIVALIATPQVLNVINDAKDSSRTSSLSGYADAVKLKATTDYFNNGGTYSECFDLKDLVLNNDSVVCSEGYYTSDNKVLLGNCTVNGEGTYWDVNGKVTSSKPDDFDSLKGTSITSNSCHQNITETPDSCFTFNVGTGAITNYDFDNCSSDVVIPNTIEGFKVKNIGQGAFVDTDNLTCYARRDVVLKDKTYIHTEGDGYDFCGFETPPEAKFLTSVVLPDNLENIGLQSFSYSQITSVTTPNSLITIGDMAFYQNAITDITISDGVTTIGESAFGANLLTELAIPNSVTKINAYAFGDNNIEQGNATIDNVACDIDVSGYAFSSNMDPNASSITPVYLRQTESCQEQLAISACFSYNLQEETITNYDEVNCSSDVVIPSQIHGVTILKIADNAFARKNLTSVILPSTITEIGNQAFTNNLLSSIILPEGLIKISDNAFDYNQIANLNIPNSLTYLSGFAGNQISSLTIPNNVITIGNRHAFSGNAMSSLSLGSSITTIGDYAFSSNQLTSIVIPNSVNSLSGFDSNLLTSITIPDSVTSIGDSAFSDNQIPNVFIPKNVASIGDGILSADLVLSTLTVDEDNLSLKSVNNAIYTKDGTTLLMGSSSVANSILSTVTTIGNRAFDRLKLTGGVTLPSNLITIGEFAFQDDNLTSITIPSSVVTILKGAFNCNSITSLTLPSNLKTIGDSAFGQSDLTSITIPNGVTYLSGFDNNLLTSIIIPNGVISIGQGAFNNNSLTSVEIPNSVTSIAFYAFANNNITQGNAKIDNVSGNVALGYLPFNNNGPQKNTNIIPTYLR